MALIASLREFTQGKLSREQLLAEFDSSLRSELSDTDQLQAAIDEVSRWEQFPGDITHVLKTRLVELGRSGTTGSNPGSFSFGAYFGNHPFAFASYADEDAAAVAAELSWLSEQGIRLSFRESRVADTGLSGFATQRIADCRLLLYFLTPTSADDQRARQELALAMDQAKPTIIVYLAPTELPIGLQLSTGNLPSVRCYEQAPADYRPMLLTCIHELLGSAVSAEPASPTPGSLTPGSTSPPSGPKVGDLLDDRFLLLEEIGEGGMSIVFKATDTETYGKPLVAVKVLNAAFARHPDALITLKREAAKSRALAHPNIVNVYDFVTSEHAYMWMEYLEGRSLSDRLREGSGRIGQAETSVILEGVVNALTYAHASKIVHADFKPANVMLTHEPVTNPSQVKVIDFGIAQAVRHPDDVNEAQTIFDIRSLRAFTIGYASPQLIDSAVADIRDDVYALACIAYEMLTGRHPFNRESAKRAQQKSMQVEARPELNRKQLAAIRHALAFDRDDRTDNSEAFLHEFNARSLRRPELSSRALLGIAFALLLVLVGSQMDTIAGWFAPGVPQPGDQFSDCEGCPQLTVLPKGSFIQGSERGQGYLRSQTPQRQVTIAAPIAVGTHEVTVAEFERFVSATDLESAGCTIYRNGRWSFDRLAGWADPGFAQSGEQPVVCVGWSDAQAFAAWLSSATGKTYRLPSASEWEYMATGAAATTSEASLPEDLCTRANVADLHARTVFAGWDVHPCNDGFVYTAPVGQFEANQAGIRDTLGNVFEWVADCWHPSYEGAPSDGSAWLREGCMQRELRGGSWFTQPTFVSASFRNNMAAREKSSSIGFRVVRELDTPPDPAQSTPTGESRQ